MGRFFPMDLPIVLLSVDSLPVAVGTIVCLALLPPRSNDLIFVEKSFLKEEMRKAVRKINLEENEVIVN